MTATDSQKPRPACPICGKPQEPALRPFCSRRCADIDLARWLRGDYVIPGERAPDAPPGEEET
ncbi:MAG: DNA gyrase inhibitor YacG [Paracoccus sp. (in: a-proteobacteria)]|nr:DNA gyrase inhibitor YacG [Paracoccus sp. (in: a-proteobacteria)]